MVIVFYGLLARRMPPLPPLLDCSSMLLQFLYLISFFPAA
jgi:hypothetical protein